MVEKIIRIIQRVIMERKLYLKIQHEKDIYLKVGIQVINIKQRLQRLQKEVQEIKLFMQNGVR